MSLGKKIVFSVELLRPFVSVNRDFVIFFAALVTLKIIENTEFLMRILRPLCAQRAYESGTGAHAKCACQELMLSHFSNVHFV